VSLLERLRKQALQFTPCHPPNQTRIACLELRRNGIIRDTVMYSLGNGVSHIQFVYCDSGEHIMTTTAAVFMSGNSQAVRLPKEFQLKSKRVTIERRGDEIVLREAPQTMKEFLDKLPIIPDAPFDLGDEGPVEPVEVW